MLEPTVECHLTLRCTDFIMRNHRVHGVSVMPGVTFLDIVYRVLMARGADHRRAVLRNVLFTEAVATAEGLDRQIRLRIGPEEAGVRTVTGQSRAAHRDRPEGEWSHNFSAELSFTDEPEPTLNAAELAASATTRRSIAELYAQARSELIEHGAPMRCTGPLFQGPGGLLAELELESGDPAHERGFHLHPAKLDAASLVAFGQRPSPEEPFIPVFIDYFRAPRPLRGRVRVHVPAPERFAPSGDVVDSDCRVFDAEGRLIAEFRKLTCKRIRHRELITRLVARDAPADQRTAVPDPRPEPQEDGERDGAARLSRTLRLMVADLLGRDPDTISTTTGFYDLGLDSMALLRISQDLEKLLGTRLYPTLLFEFSDIASLAAHLAAEYGPSAADREGTAEAAPGAGPETEANPETAPGTDERAAPKDSAAETIYRTAAWGPVPDRPAADPADPGDLVVVGAAAELAEALRRHAPGRRIVHVGPGEQVADLGGGTFQAPVGDREAATRLLSVLAEHSIEPRTLVVAGELTGNDTPYLAVWALAAALAERSTAEPCELLYLHTAPGGAALPQDTAVGALARVLSAEVPTVHCRRVEVDADPGDAATCAAAVRAAIGSSAHELRYRDGELLARGYVPYVPAPGALPLRDAGVYVLAGGTGGIGTLLADHLCRTHRARLALIGTGPLPAELAERIAAWEAAGAQVLHLRADLADETQVTRALEAVRERYGRVNGVFHCAGRVRDAVFFTKSAEDAAAVLAPKVAGTVHLDRATADDALDLFVLFSSVSAALANPGQCDYAYANAFQEQFARERAGRRDRSGRTLAIGWPYWAEGGMRVGPDTTERARRDTGLAPMPTSQALRTLHRLGAGPAVAVSVAHGDRATVDRVIPPAPTGPATEDAAGPAGATARELPATAHLLPDTAERAVAVVGVAGRYPKAAHPREFWANLAEGRDCVTEVPSDRWDHDAIYDPRRGTPGTTYGRWGGFLDAADHFDHAFFGISRRDAERMDPQERLFLTVAWQALEDAGHPPQALAGQPVGVYVGVMWNHYQLVGSADDGVAPLATHSAVANRVSHLLDLHGPSIALDTACSSSLTAVHLAAEAVRRGDCDLALAGGVNLILHPQKYLQLAQGRFLSDDGRCRAFGADGTGYVPGEGAGAVLLKPLDQAIADGDHVYAVVRGSQLNHSGRTSGFTVPDPAAQASLLRATLRRAAVHPGDIGYLEAHGTGTSLGDPIEVEGIGRALAGAAAGSVAIGSVKTNIGHLESAAGVAGLTKVLLQFRYGRLVPSLHAETPNPHIDFASSPVRVQQRLQRWDPPGDGPRLAGISAFGAGGSNAHVILQEAPRAPERGPAPGPHLFVLSAASETALRAYADSYLEYLDEEESGGAPPDLADLARTSRVGRTVLPVRLGAVVDDLDALRDVLRRYVEGRPPGGGGHWGTDPGAEPPRVDPGALLRDGRLEELADAWVRGTAVDWRVLEPPPWRIVPMLPPYPFQEERCWLGDWRSRNAEPPSPAPARPAPEPRDTTDAPAAVEAAPRKPGEDPRPEPGDEPEPQQPSAVRLAVTRAIEEALCAELYVDRSEIDPATPFRDMGVDSVTAEVVREELSERLAVEIDSVAVYDHPTVERLAAFVTTLGPRLPDTDTGGAPPSPQAAEPAQPKDRVEPAGPNTPPAGPPGDGTGRDRTGPTGRAPSDDIAVIGMSGRFPDAPDLDAFWTNLVAGHCSVAEIPARRWDVDSCYDPDQTAPGKTSSRWAALLDDVDAFDAGFFGVSPLEAQSMDPQQRLFLQEAWKALEDAGYAARGPRSPGDCGVFVGSGAGDYGRFLDREGLLDSGYGFLGTAPSILAARIAYQLDLAGPTLAVDTACSSSLVAVHLACRSIRDGECETALAGGVSLMLTPQLQIRCSQVGMLSPTGRCLPFDAAADGTVLGEGVGVVVLKRLDRALADGDRIHGVIRASGVNGDGRTNGITAPSATAQTELITDVHRRAGIHPDDIGYVEAHGTGTPLGDPIEVKALARALAGSGEQTGHRALGSVKANIGHTTMAAGVASLIKVLLAMRHRVQPPTAGFTAPNPAIDLADTPFRVPTEATEWRPGPSGRRAATVSSFGFSGTNCHLVLTEPDPAPPRTETAATAAPEASDPVVVPVSARTEEQLRRRLTELAEALDPSYAVRDVARTLALGRAHLPVRAAVVAASTGQLRQRLRELAEKGHTTEGWYLTAPAPSPEDDEAVRTAAAYTRGEDPDWKHRYGGATARTLSLPCYPFAQDRHWAGERTWRQDQDEAAVTAEEDTPPLRRMSHLLTEGPAPGVYRLDTARTRWLLEDHRVNGTRLLPAAATLDAVVSAARHGGLRLPVRLSSVRWPRPLTAPRGQDVSADLTLADDGRFTVADGTGSPHVTGAVTPLRARHADAVDLRAVRERCPSTREAARIYSSFEESGLEYGAGLRVLTEVSFTTDEALATLAPPPAPVPPACATHPSLLDGALQAASVLLPEDGEPVAPFSVETVDIHAPLAEARHVHVARESEHRFTIRVTDDRGTVLARLLGLALRPLADPVDRLIHLPRWQRAAEPAAPPPPRGRTLVVHTDTSTDLAHAIRDLHAHDPVTLAPLSNDGTGGRITEAFDHVYVLARTADDTDESFQDRPAVELLRLLKELVDGPRPESGKLTVALFGAVAADPAEQVRPSSAALLGLARAFGAEHPRWSVRCVDLGTGPVDPASAAPALLAAHADTEPVVALRAGRRLVRTQVPARLLAPTTTPFRRGGRYLVAGGAGGLGLVLSRHLARTAGAHLVWVGRRPQDAEITARMAQISELGGHVTYVRADLTDGAALRDAVERVRAEHGPIHGAVHSAAVLADRTLANLDEETLREVLAPKTAGAVNLWRALRGDPLDFLLFFSSAASFVEAPGQANYAAASTFLDAYALRLRNTDQVRALVVNWGYWADTGMGATDLHRRRFAELGVGSINPDEGMAVLDRLVAAGTPQALVVKADASGLARFGIGTAPPTRAATPATTTQAQDTGGSGAALTARARGYVKRVFAEVLRYRQDQLDERTTFENFGVDSLVSLNIIRRFESDLGDLPSTLLFEHLTIEHLAEYFATEHRERLASVTASGRAEEAAAEHAPNARAESGTRRSAAPGPVVPHSAPEATAPADIAVVGVSGRYPGSPDLAAYWRNLVDGVDCVTEIPARRWDWRPFFDPRRGTAQRTYSRWGGFLEGVDLFDPGFFGILPRDAADIDPQERLFLETAWNLLEETGHLGEHTREPKTGVFVGIMYGTYGELGATQWPRGRLSGAHSAYWSVANRVSYTFDLSGPSFAVDSACSSSLTAVHLAVESLRRGECRMAIAGGVNLILHPNHHVSLSASNMLSADGACKTFDSRADGYVPGEGVGAVLLKPLDRAVADGDRIWAVIRGSTVNAGGKTAGFTVPNPRAQAELIAEAMERAGVPPATVGYLEAHGTGTELGDPVEVAALTRAYGGTPAAPPAVIGSVKANIGHLEAAAGIAGLTKVLLQLRHRRITPSVHLDTPNPKIDFSRSPFRPVREPLEWERPVLELDGAAREHPRRAGISSFGAGGANAHLVVEEYTGTVEETAPDDGIEQLFVLSAHTTEALRELASRVAAYVADPRACDATLRELAYTSQVGRQEMTERVAVVAADREELAARLRAFAAGEPHPDVAEGNAGAESAAGILSGDDAAEFTAALAARRNLPKLGRAWTLGAPVDWRALWDEPRPGRVPFPTSVFRRRRYWLTTDGPVLPEPPAHTPDPAELRLDGKAAHLHDHRVRGTRWLPGAALLEAALDAAPGDPTGVRDVRWHRPVDLDTGPHRLTVRFDTAERPARFRVTDPGEDGPGYVEGAVTGPADPQLAAEEDRSPQHVERIRARCPRTVAADAFYRRLREGGLDYGRSLRVIDALHVGEGECLARLLAPEPADERETPTVALIDGAFQATAALVAEDACYVPAALDRLETTAGLPRSCWVHVRQTPGKTPGRRRFDLRLMADDGADLLVAEGLEVAAVGGPPRHDDLPPPAPAPDRSEPRYLRPVWRPAPETPPQAADRSRTALVLASDGALTTEVVHLLRARGVHCELAVPGTGYGQRADGVHTLAPENPEQARRLVDDLATRGVHPDLVVRLDSDDAPHGAEPAAQLAEGFHAVFWPAAALLARDRRAPLRIVVAHPADETVFRPQHAATSGLLRTLELEHSGCTGVRVEFAPKTPVERAAAVIAAEACADGTDDSVVRHDGTARWVRELEEFAPDGSADPADLPLRPGGTYLLTGGAGALGQRFTEFLCDRGPVNLVLTGRSEPDPQRRAWLERLNRPGVKVRYLPADVSDRGETTRLLAAVREEFGELHGVIHAAGVVRDARAVRKTPEQAAEVLAPKVHGVVHLDELSAGEPLDFFVVFSSATAETGNLGQADYGYANAFLDEFVRAREAARTAGSRRGRTVSIGWPLWRDGGMTVDEATLRLMARRWDIAPLRTETGLRAFCHALTGSTGSFVVFEPASGGETTNRPGDEPGTGNREETGTGTRPAAHHRAGAERDLRELTADFLLVDQDEVDVHADLMELGFDSVSLTELVNRVNDRYGLDLLPTVLFDHPTLARFADHLAERYGQELAAQHTTATEDRQPTPPPDPQTAAQDRPRPLPDTGRPPAPQAHRTKIAVVGMAGVLPGAADLDAFWRRLAAGENLVGAVPPDRTDLRADPRTRHTRGGFVDDPAAFDADLFGISPREAALMDPQQRLFLQVVWRTLEDAGHRPTSLAGTPTGLFAGVATSDYDNLLARHGVAAEAHMATGVAHAVLANRVSYLLDLRGPSEAVDTACSSALVAIHRAVRAIQAGECDAAIAGGVSVLLSPGVFTAFDQAGMLSPDGSCKTFDAAADGYVRGEGAGAILLKPLDRALDDGDHVYAVIRGSAVNHGGRAASLTAPTPSAQADVVARAHRDAGVDPATVGYIEAHGTGTRLGDPIEIEALKQAFTRLYADWGHPRPAEPVTGIGSVKTNIGHLEAAAGIAGVLKVLLAMEHGQLPALLHLRQANPHLRLDGSPFYLVDRHQDWPSVPEPDGTASRRAGVSSFGFGGSNAHVVLEQRIQPEPSRRNESPTDRPEIFVLSAPSSTALAEYADTLADHLSAHRDTELSDVAHTLRVGRAELRERLAVVASTRGPLVAALRAAAAGRPATGLHRGTAARDAAPRQGGAATTVDALDELARAWVAGSAVDWTRGLPDTAAKRLRLPSFPFDRTRHWFAAPTTGSTTETAVRTPNENPPAPGPGNDDRRDRPPQPPRRRPRVRLAAVDTVAAAPARTHSPDTPTPDPDGPRAAEPEKHTAGADDPGADTTRRAREAVRTRLAQILDLPAAKIEDDRPFAELGLDSVFRMDLARLLNDAYGLQLQAAELYEHDTVDRLARFVDRAVAARTLPRPPAEQTAADPAAPRPPKRRPPEPDTSETAEPGPDGAQPSAASERSVRELVESVLSRPLDRDREFADSGMTSFDMLRVVSALERQLGGLRKTLLFDHPTPEKLAAFLCAEYGHHAVTALRAPQDPRPPRPPRPPAPRSAADLAAEPLIVERRAAARSQLRDLMADLERRYAKETGLAGRDIAPLAFIGSSRAGYLTFSRRDDNLFAWSYVGPDEYFTELAAEYLDHARANGLKANFLSLRRLEEAGGHRLTATPFGAVQRLEDIGSFSTRGGAMSRLRYMVRRFQRAGDCRTVEYRSGTDPETDRRLVELIDQWASGKQMTNPYVRTVREEIAAGTLPDRHRIFLTYAAGRMANAVVVTRVPSENGYLLDVEFYPADMPLGGLEYAIVEIVSTLRDEGCTLFTFGASFGVKIGESGNADPEVADGLDQLRSVGVFGSGNFQFKNKFRPTNHPIYLCRPAEGPTTSVADIILMIADPSVAAETDEAAARRSCAPPADEPGEPQPAPPAVFETTAEDRAALLARYGHNPVLIPHDRIEYDLITDSWAERVDRTAADRIRRLTERALGEPAPADTAPSWLPFGTVVAVTSGRAAEALLCRSWPGRRGTVVHNGLFPTWLFALADHGFTPVESDGATGADGDLDPDALARTMAEHSGDTAFLAVELACNAAGGRPISPTGLRRVRALAQRHGVPLVVDATRVLDNAALVAAHDPEQRGRDLWDVARDLLAQADAVTISATKDFGVAAGGLVATDLPELAERIPEQAELRGPVPSLLERRMLAHALNDHTGVPELVEQRVAGVRSLWRRLAEAGAPLAGEPGGHCVLLDVARWPAAAGLRHPVASFLAWMYRHTGVRGGPHLAGDGLVRLAVPVGYGRTEIAAAADRLAELFTTAPEPADLVAVSGGSDTDPGARVTYHVADQIPDDLREVVAEGHRPVDRNWQVLREQVPQVRRSLLGAPGGDVEVFDAGEEGPTVLLMHPFNMGAAAFAHQFRALADRYRVVVVHHPGVGATTADADISLDGISDLQSRALDDLGVSGPVHVVGASFGSLLAQNFALRHPERTRSLSLICGSYRYANRRGGINRLELVVAEDLDRIAESTGAAWTAAQREALQAELLRSESMDPRIGLRYLDVFAGEPDLLPRLADIAAPTLIVQGRHDSVVPLKTAHLLHGLIPDATYAELAEAGHFPCVTHPDEVNRVLTAFLSDIADSESAPRENDRP